jgi:HPt (histidine-containing phosphotransfer) domain-containing protein
VFLLSLAVVGAEFYASRDLADRVVRPAVYLILGFGFCGVILGLSVLARRERPASPKILEALDTLNMSLARIREQLQTPQSPAPATETASPRPALFERPESPLSTPASNGDQRVVELLEDIRAISLMNETQRQARLQQFLDEHRAASLARVDEAMERKDWAHAEHLLNALDEQFPRHSDIVRARHRLAELRGTVEVETFSDVKRKIDSHIANGSWDQAMSTAQAFVRSFPSSSEGRTQLERVKRERDAHSGPDIDRMYQEIRRHVESRSWRRALGVARQMIDQHGTDPRATPVKQQLATLEENAEIEERQEQEVRIEELIRAGRLVDAVHLADDLVVRYPDSPQALSLEKMLPQLRTMAVEQGANPEEVDPERESEAQARA